MKALIVTLLLASFIIFAIFISNYLFSNPKGRYQLEEAITIIKKDCKTFDINTIREKEFSKYTNSLIKKLNVLSDTNFVNSSKAIQKNNKYCWAVWVGIHNGPGTMAYENKFGITKKIIVNDFQ